jgi:hypothetical protein
MLTQNVRTDLLDNLQAGGPVTWDGIFKLLRSPGIGIDSKEFIPPAYAAWARICKPFKVPRNRFLACRTGTTTIFDVLARKAT